MITNRNKNKTRRLAGAQRNLHRLKIKLTFFLLFVYSGESRRVDNMYLCEVNLYLLQLSTVNRSLGM